MAKLNDIKQNVGAIREGRWFDWINGIKLRIASMQSETFQEGHARLRREHEAAAALEVAETSDVAKKAAAEIMAEAIARWLLLDWKNVEDDDGEPEPYTWERGFELLMDTGYTHLRAFVLTKAMDERNYFERAVRDDEGKSEG